MAKTMNQAAKSRRTGSRAAPLPPILTLREFVAEMERKYGDRAQVKALKAAIGETQPNE